MINFERNITANRLTITQIIPIDYTFIVLLEGLPQLPYSPTAAAAAVLLLSFLFATVFTHGSMAVPAQLRGRLLMQSGPNRTIVVAGCC